ncbi:MAG: magnesium transporter CorA family protein [Polaromonas sp.]|nr:magnesium transporter CorA family protein [Polaromonas sp.]
MQIVEFTSDSLRFADALPAKVPADGFVWMFLDRDEFESHGALIQQAAQQLGGSALLDLHRQDLGNAVHPSHYDYTSIYDLIIFRRLATQVETHAEVEHEAAVEAYHGQGGQARIKPRGGLPAFNRISSKAVGFVVFDRLLISVHPRGCYTAKTFIQRSLTDAKFSVDSVSARSRIPASPADLVLRMINAMVDSYLDVRKELTTQLEHWQAELLKPNSRFVNWGSLMGARSQLHVLEDLCDEQHDAMQEWLDSLREQPMSSFAADAQLAQTRRDQLVARARDVIEHIQRVVHHARRLEQSAETVVQIHFSAQSNRTNDIMRTLTALTAIFLPLNLITGFFGMNFEFMPLIHHVSGFWWTFSFMLLIVVVVGTVFWRKQYIARTRR